MSVNLAALDTAVASEIPFEFELKGPTGDKLGLFVQVRGRDCEAVRAVNSRRRNQALKKNFEAQRGAEVEAGDLIAEEIDQATAELLAAATVGWYEKKGKAKEDGFPFGDTRLMFSQEEAAKLYMNPGFKWLADQVDKAAYNVGNFIKP